MGVILRDYECEKCGHIQELIAAYEKKFTICPKCGGQANAIISLGSVYTANEDAPWIRTVLEVVDKDSKASHVREFLKNPTRTNYRNWMKKEGLRPLDSNVGGAPPVLKRADPDLSGVRREVFEKHRQRNRIEI